MRELADAVARHDVAGLMFSTHGCAFALVDDNQLLHPILDYEQEIPDSVAAVIDPILPDYSETYTPWLPLGFSISRHIYWLETEEPELFAASEWILCFPQYWVWQFTGRPVAEWSYIGAHNQLWAPLKRDFSSLVGRMGWREKFPPIVPAGAVVGEASVALADGSHRRLSVHNGVHDSNSALAYYRMTGLTGFTIVSTGTWVIIINLDCPLPALDAERDMISNVTVNGEPAPSLRFMGGREFDLISEGWEQPISQASVERVMARGIFVLPSWAAGGPFPETSGRIVGGDVEGEERAAAAALYVVMMTDLSLDLIHSDNLLVVDGGLARIDLFTAMLAQLRPTQSVVRSAMSEGSATGAAALAFKALGLSPFQDETTPVVASRIAGLEAYRERWRERAEGDRAAARAGAKRMAK
jgi:sugar (pentulose or hexulose) kinase